MAIRPVAIVAKKRQSAPPVRMPLVRRRSVGELLDWMRKKSGEHLARTYLGMRPRSPTANKAKIPPAKAPKKP